MKYVRGRIAPTKFFDSNSAAEYDGIFGLPYNLEESKIVLLPVPWEATTSYGGGTAKGPNAILNASHQVDLFDLELGNFFEEGIFMIKESKQVKAWNQKAKLAAKKKSTKIVNELSSKVNDYTYAETKKFLDQNKIVGLVGGDHSSPMGTIQAYVEKYPDLGVLHFDAHADMRKAYQGFTDSHASIMYNVITRTKLAKLVQVGIRDFCEEEMDFIRTNEGRVFTFFDQRLSEKKFSGATWEKLCADIVYPLPKNVYISFDIDGLDPAFCPNTGTPVPGGLSFIEAAYLIQMVVKSGRKIVGFDLNEVAPGDNEWDANVGARLLYKLCGWSLKS
jgi:agmatinase